MTGAHGDIPAGYEPVDAAPSKKPTKSELDERRVLWNEAVADLNETYALVLIGGHALVLREGEDMDGRPTIEFLSKTAFKTWFENRRHPMYPADPDETLATAWLSHPRRRQYAGIVFAPDGAPPEFYNLWRGFAVEPAPRMADWRDHRQHFPVLYDHVLTNVARGNADIANWVWAWFAHAVQRPTERLGKALVLRGKQGTGKTIVGESVGALFGPHYVLVDDARYLTGQFNAHMASCLLLQCDEGFWAGDKAAEGRLKGLVTSRNQMIEKKGVDPIMVRNLVRLMISSNHDWVIPAGMEERRFAVLDVGDGCMQDQDYFAELRQELRNGGYPHLLAYLQAFDLSTVSLSTVPATFALFEQKLAGLPLEHSYWYERLREGLLHKEHGGWRREVTTGTLYGGYLAHADRIGRKSRMDCERFVMALAKLMPDGWRRKRMVAEDGGQGRPWGYTIPPLADCRAKFCELARWQVDWDEPAEGLAEADPPPVEGVP